MEVCAHFMCGRKKKRKKQKGNKSVTLTKKKGPWPEQLLIFKLLFFSFKFSHIQEMNSALCCIACHNNNINNYQNNSISKKYFFPKKKKNKARKAVTSFKTSKRGKEKNKKITGQKHNKKIYISTTEVIGSTLDSAAVLVCVRGFYTRGGRLLVPFGFLFFFPFFLSSSFFFFLLWILVSCVSRQLHEPCFRYAVENARKV